MHERLTRKSVTFKHPFSLPGIDDQLEAGVYVVETQEELIEGLSFVAFRRVATTIVADSKTYGKALRQIVTIDPQDLQIALERDANIDGPTS